MSRILTAVLALVASVIALAALTDEAASQGKRVALVIGNSAYVHTGALANPKNDAADMAAALKKLGFQVVEGFDVDKAAFDRKVRDFANALEGAAVGLFFYAGHGLAVEGQNYLVPVDAQLTSAVALEFEMVRADTVHRVMERQAKTNILFLDACRDNPLSRNLARSMGTRSAAIGRGLAPIESGIGTLISFSTQPGNVASDGSGRNSPFAGALVKHLSTSKNDLSAILMAVRNDVMKETQRRQVPWEHSALTGRFYFSPPRPAQASLPKAPELPPDAIISDLFTEADLARTTELAVNKKLPLPVFKIFSPNRDVPEKLRRFVGIWASNSGFRGTDRQWMTIIVSVNKEGKAYGYHSRGPPTPNSVQNPASVIPFTALISGDAASYNTSDSKVVISFTAEDRLRYVQTFHTGQRAGSTVNADLAPVWSLVGAERSTKR